MNQKCHLRATARWFATSLGVAAAAYGTYAAVAWYRYGNPGRPHSDEQDLLLDRFMPTYDVAERHAVRVAAPPAVTLAVAREVDLQGTPLVRAIFKAREVILAASPDDRPRPRGLLAELQSLGWGMLVELPEREVVLGAVTRPWEPNVTFRALPSEQFAAFSEPGYVKIAWTLRVESIGATDSIFRTETRAVATDPTARARFRRYWAFLSPGIILIRWALLASLKNQAERWVRSGASLST